MIRCAWNFQKINPEIVETSANIILFSKDKQTSISYFVIDKHLCFMQELLPG